jgi:hypothetical protein
MLRNRQPAPQLQPENAIEGGVAGTCLCSPNFFLIVNTEKSGIN